MHKGIPALTREVQGELAAAKSAEEIFSSNKVDAVLIATATPTHADYIEMAVAAGKAALCEKPIDLNLARLQWLTERGMVEPAPDGGVRPTTAAMNALANREIDHAAEKYSTASGLHAARVMDGGRFEGTYRQPISLASGKFAVFENSKEFTLVPWRPSFEDIRGKEVIGKVNGSTIAWELAGRSRGQGI